MSQHPLEQRFPGLRGEPYQITSDPDPRYNCIAWAAGCTDRWWQPLPHLGYFWPFRTYEWSVPALAEVFRRQGYEECDSAVLEPGYEKVAIYAKGTEPTHASRQLPSGLWTSKCGQSWDIDHDLGCLEGCQYGQVVKIMRRKRR